MKIKVALLSMLIIFSTHLSVASDEQLTRLTVGMAGVPVVASLSSSDSLVGREQSRQGLLPPQASGVLGRQAPVIYSSPEGSGPGSPLVPIQQLVQQQAVARPPTPQAISVPTAVSVPRWILLCAHCKNMQTMTITDAQSGRTCATFSMTSGADPVQFRVNPLNTTHEYHVTVDGQQRKCVFDPCYAVVNIKVEGTNFEYTCDK